MLPRTYVDLLAGGLFVLFHAATRFNTPATNRSSTTAGRFFLALALYVGAGLGLYVALVQFPHLVSFLVQGDADQIPDTARALSSPLLVALLMTVLLPKLPVLSGADAWLRRTLQELASIPGEVRRLAAELRRQPLRLAPEAAEAVRRALLEEGLDPRDVQIAGDGPAALWTTTTALLQELEAWDGDRGMLRYLGERGEELDKLRARRLALRPRAKTCFRLLRETGAGAADDPARETARQYAEDVGEQLAQLHRDVVEFVSRGVLRAGLTDAARQQRLAALGFTVVEAPPAFTLDELLSLAAVLAVVMLSALVLLSPRDVGVTAGVLLVRAVMVSAFYTVAVACAVVPRRRWAAARRDAGARPIAFYLLAGAMAVAITQVVGFGFDCLLERGVAAGFARYRLTYPWLLVTFTTAAMTAALVDDPVSRRPRVQRALEGLAGAVALAAAAAFTHRWLADVLEQALGRDRPIPMSYRLPSLGIMLVVSSVVGFVIGALVPHWHRDAPRAAQRCPTPVPEARRAVANA